MSMPELFHALAEPIPSAAGINLVYGAPITAAGKTIIPVSKVLGGYGGGAGRRQPDQHTEEGSGGGCGFRAMPLGLFEITADRTRFVPVQKTMPLLVAAAGGFLLGNLLTRRHR